MPTLPSLNRKPFDGISDYFDCEYFDCEGLEGPFLTVDRKIPYFLPIGNKKIQPIKRSSRFGN